MSDLVIDSDVGTEVTYVKYYMICLMETINGISFTRRQKQSLQKHTPVDD